MPGEKAGEANPFAPILHPSEIHPQLTHRHAPTFFRRVLDGFRQQSLTATQPAAQLKLSPMIAPYRSTQLCKLWIRV